jgi:hypothetical protein
MFDLHSNHCAMLRALADPLASGTEEAYLQIDHYVALDLAEG